MDDSITIENILATQETQQRTINTLKSRLTEQAGLIEELQTKVDNLEALKG